MIKNTVVAFFRDSDKKVTEATPSGINTLVTIHYAAQDGASAYDMNTIFLKCAKRSTQGWDSVTQHLIQVFIDFRISFSHSIDRTLFDG